MSSYSRETELKKQLNLFLTDSLHLPNEDYYSNLDTTGFLQLKSVLSAINNIFTLKVTLSFAQWLVDYFDFNNESKKLLDCQIQETKPNTNGFDVEISKPKKIIAEVKCNVPINNGIKYGSAQKNGIIKDINALIYGKSKSNINPNDYYKFMVFLDKPEIKEATKHFVENMKEHKDKIVFANKITVIKSKEYVYVIYASI